MALETHNVYVGRSRTSIRCEPILWDALARIAKHEQRTVFDLVTNIDRQRLAGEGRTSAIRAYVVRTLLSQFP